MAVKTLDLRKMPAFKRHVEIFNCWNKLKENNALRIINDHDPKPLYYQFQAEQKAFEWKYEKQGPKDWIVSITKTSAAESDNESKRKIKELIKKLHSGADANELKKQGRTLLKNISPSDLAMIEQEIINEGVSRKEMRKLCDIHLEMMGKTMAKTKIKLKPGHPIDTLMKEHKEILRFIDKMKSCVKAINRAKEYYNNNCSTNHGRYLYHNYSVKQNSYFNNIKKELEILEHVAEHLVEADKHHKREEDVLFPALEKHGITEPPAIMREDHIELKAKKKELYKIAKSLNKKIRSNLAIGILSEQISYFAGS